MDDKDKAKLECSFCGKTQHEVRKLIAAPRCCICDECVELCTDILREEGMGSSSKPGLRFDPADAKAGTAALSDLLDHVRAKHPDGDAQISILRDDNALRVEVRTAAGGFETLERRFGGAPNDPEMAGE